MVILKFQYDKNKVALAKKIGGGKFNKEKKYWEYPNYLLDDVKKSGIGDVSLVDENKCYDKYEICPFITKPFEHQKLALGEALKRNGYALFCETGTGKTKIALDCATIRMSNHLIQKVLIVCPKTGVGVWEEEIEKHTKMYYTSLIGTKAERQFKLSEFLSLGLFAIINYEGLLVLEEELKKCVDEKWMLILDESTWIKNPKKSQSQRTAIAIDLAKKSKYRMILSGAPILNNIMDIFSQWFIVDVGEAFGFSWYKFRNDFFIPSYMNFNWTPKKELYMYVEEVLEKASIRILKKNCLDLPEKIYEKRFIEMDERQGEVYESMVENMLVFFEGKTISVDVVIAQMTKLHQIANGFMYQEDGSATRISNKKYNALMEILEENPKSNTIIWTHFKEDMNFLYNKLCEKYYNVRRMDSKNATEIVKEYQNCMDKQIVLISNPKSCGYAITLTNTDIVIYYSNSFDAGERYQSEDRCHRIGLKHSVVYLDLITKNTIEEKIINVLLQKQDLMKEVLDYKNFLKGKK